MAKEDLLPFSGSEGSRSPTAAKTDAEARARVAELSETLSEVVARDYPSFKPGMEEYFDENTQAFTGADGIPMGTLPTSGTHHPSSSRDRTKTFDEICQEAVRPFSTVKS